MPRLKSLPRRQPTTYTKSLAHLGPLRQLRHESGRSLTGLTQAEYQLQPTRCDGAIKSTDCCCCLSSVGSKGPMQLLDQATGRQGAAVERESPTA